MKNNFKRSRAIFAVIGLIFLLLAASCGGSSSSGDDVDKGGGEPLGTYDFSLSFLDDHPIQITSGTEPEATVITLEGPTGNSHITGSYDLGIDTITFNSGPFVKVTTNLWDGAFWINLNTNIESVDGNHPMEGEVKIAVGEDPIHPEYFVIFTINSTDTGTTVEIQKIQNDITVGTTSCSWESFEELFWSEEDAWERQASFGYYVISYYLYEIKFVASAILLIEENDTGFPTESVTVNGDTFPGTPPPGHDALGNLVLSCTSGDGGPGSDFSEVFDDYWVEDSLDLFEGTVNFVGFLEDSDEERDVITAIGFIPNSEEDPGGVFYDEEGLTIYDTIESSPGVYTIADETSISITGRYTIMFLESES